MRKILLLVAIAAMLGACTRVDPGYVGIKVIYYGAPQGVRGEPLVLPSGAVWYLPFTTSVFAYPTFQQTTSWTAHPQEGRQGRNDEITYNSSEGLVFQADISVAYRLIGPRCIPEFYRRFRSDDLETFTHGFLRNVAREHFNDLATRFTAEQLYGAEKENYLQRTRSLVNRDMEPLCVHVEQLGYIGPPRPPAEIVTSINRKIQAIQDAIRVENELRQATAEAKKQVATAEGSAGARLKQAEAEAKANALLAASLSEPLLRWRALEVQKAAVERWNGQRPQFEVGGGAGMPSLLLNVPGAATR